MAGPQGSDAGHSISRVAARRTSYLSKRHAPVGLAALAFLGLAQAVLTDTIALTDQAIVSWVRQLDSNAMDVSMRVVTSAGSFPGIVVFTTLFSLWALRQQRRQMAVLVAATAALTEGANELLKILFGRARPVTEIEVAIPASYSFPSGHAMVSLAVYGMTALLLAESYPRLRPILVVVTPLLVLLIGFSRVYLGVHWPSDVVAGFAAGWLLIHGIWLVGGRWGRPG
jgi:undecaprenyl-diphosphatase